MNAAAVTAVATLLAVVALGWIARPRPIRRSVGAPPGDAARRRSVWPLRRRHRVSATAVADYLGAIAREVRAGGTVTAAFSAVTPDHAGGATLRPACRLVSEGMPLDEALHSVTAPAAGHDRELDVAVHTLSCAATVGGSAAVTIDAAASVLRERAAVAADARAHSAQARLSGRVLTIVPVAFAAWSAATDPRIRRTYTATSFGAVCVVAGLSLNLVGWWWMRRIVAAGGGR